jgi:hypothetical protein
MTRRPSALLAAALLACGAVALSLSGCAGGPEVDTTATASMPPATRPVETPAPDAAAPAETAAPVTCDTLISEDTRAELEAQGWTVRDEPFLIDTETFDDGLQCTWGDFSTATGNVLMFGWAPIDSELAADLQATLVEQGWTREEGEDGVYVTEDPSHALTVDENGYGLTYLFGDGWVTFGDTKQSLLLIERPTD